MTVMTWKLFIGSCILVAGLLFKVGVPLVPIAAGIAVAGLVTWKLPRRTNTLRR
jgi:hypothetical protein